MKEMSNFIERKVGPWKLPMLLRHVSLKGHSSEAAQTTPTIFLSLSSAVPYLAGPAGKVILLLIRGVWNSPSAEHEAAQQYSTVEKPRQQRAILAGPGVWNFWGRTCILMSVNTTRHCQNPTGLIQQKSLQKGPCGLYDQVTPALGVSGLSKSRASQVRFTSGVKQILLHR